MKNILVNGRWPLTVPDHRADRPQWPWWEATRLACMHHYLRPGQTIVDVGSEEGDFPALWRSWGLEVILAEPNPAVWPNIKAIWEANDLPDPLATFSGFVADGDRNGPANWRCVKYAGSVWPDSADGPIIGDHGFCNLSERPDIACIQLDNLVRYTEGTVHAITVDTEGSEFRVLKGAQRVLREHRPLVWVSVHPEFMADMYDDTPDELFAFMADCGYERTFLTADHEQHWMLWPRERELFVQ